MKIKSHFEDVDQLIANVKAVGLPIKNETRQAKFSAIGYPPQPVPARWVSWLVKCCLVLGKKFAWSESKCGKLCGFGNFSNSSKG